jgi:uncharacterized delta-60 repeat protein
MRYSGLSRIFDLDMQLQTDGKILVLVNGTGYAPRLIRVFTHNADIDSSFAGDGILEGVGPVDTILTRPEYKVFGFLPLADGRILLWGTYNSNIMMARLLNDGTLDPGFGTGGLALEEKIAPGYFSFQHTRSAAILADGTIQVSGGYGLYDDNFISYNYYQSYSLRYTADGVKLPGEHDPEPLGEFGQILPRPDGSYLAYLLFYGKYVMHLNADGSTDSTFAGTGTLDASCHQFLLQPDGRLLGIGNAFVSSDSCEGRIARWMPDGSPDTTFGPGGETFFSQCPLRNLFLDFTLQPDGRISVRYNSGMPVGSDPGALFPAFTLYPNPATEHVFFVSPLEEDAEVTCFDIQGRIISLYPEPHASGELSFRLQAGISQGMYLVRVVSNGKSWTARLLVE